MSRIMSLGSSLKYIEGFGLLFKKQTERKFLSVVKNEFSWKCSLHSEVAPSFICVVFSFVWCFIFFGFVF